MDWTGLVESVRAGDRFAAQRLVNALGALMDAYCEQIATDLGQREREQVVERALCDVVDKIDRYDQNRGTLPSWARGFVRNGVREARRQPREVAVEPGSTFDTLRAAAERDSNIYNVEPIDPDADFAPSGRETALMSLLLLLNPSEADLLYAHVIEGLTFEQIALRLDVNAAALRKRYQRIRQKVIEMAALDTDLAPLVNNPTQETKPPPL